MKKTILASASAVLCGVFFAAASFAGGGGFGHAAMSAKESTQLENNAELVSLMANAREQLDAALRNLKSFDGFTLPEFPSDLERLMNLAIADSAAKNDQDERLKAKADEAIANYKAAKLRYDDAMLAYQNGREDFDRIKLYGAVTDIRDAIQKTRGIYSVIGQMDKNFRRLYPGTAGGFSARRGLNGETFNTLSDYTEYQDRQMLQSCEDILKRYDLSMNDLDNNKKLLDTLQKKSRSSEGMLQAYQCATEVGIYQTRQMGNLEQAVRENTAQVAQIQAMKVDGERVSKSTQDEFFKPSTSEGDMKPIDPDYSEFGKKLKVNK